MPAERHDDGEDAENIDKGKRHQKAVQMDGAGESFVHNALTGSTGTCDHFAGSGAALYRAVFEYIITKLIDREKGCSGKLLIRRESRYLTRREANSALAPQASLC